MRSLVALALALISTPALADPPRLVEDGVIGLDPRPDHPVLAPPDAALARCTDAEGAAVVWLQVGRSGRVTAAHVHGAGKADACLARALASARASGKLPNAIIVVGHVDVDGQPSPRIATTPIVVDAHGAAWQLTIDRVAYTDNRMLDIGQDLDRVSPALAACASRRGRRAQAVHGSLWYDGHAVVETGNPAYDACLAHALGAIALPTPQSALWADVSIAPPGEPLAPRTTTATSHEQDLRDALTTAVRSRKLHLLGCLDGHAKTTLTHLGVELAGGHANVQAVATGDRDADACVREKFHDVAIPNASSSDHLTLDVTLDPQ